MSAGGKIGLVLAALLLLVVLYWMGSGGGGPRPEDGGIGAAPGAAGTIRRIEPLPPPPLPEPTPVTLPAPPPRPVDLTPRPPRPRQQTRPAPIFAYEEQGGQRGSAGAETPAAAQSRAGEADDALAGRLRATRTETVQARRLRDPDLTITMGTIIPCTPMQPLNTQLEGFLSCIVPVDVRGTTGRVVLLDRGTRIVGQVRSGLRQGQNRAFVLWTRAETPDGVTIELASPGTDALGQNGLDVDVETNFWARFGGAILLSFLDAGLQAAAIGASAALSNGGGNNISLFNLRSGGRSAATTALDATVNIPPYGTRPQGEPSAIFTARDLDFSSVYRLRSTRP
jgi:type IV secretion system protein VirB10